MVTIFLRLLLKSGGKRRHVYLDRDELSYWARPTSKSEFKYNRLQTHYTILTGKELS